MKPISLEDLDAFSVDDQNRLYWKGNLLQVEYKLSPWQKRWAAVVSGVIFAAAAATCFQAWVAWTMCPNC